MFFGNLFSYVRVIIRVYGLRIIIIYKQQQNETKDYIAQGLF